MREKNPNGIVTFGLVGVIAVRLVLGMANLSVLSLRGAGIIVALLFVTHFFRVGCLASALT